MKPLFRQKNVTKINKMLVMLKHLLATLGQCKSKNAWVYPPTQKVLLPIYHTVPVDSIPTDCSSLCSSNVLNVKGQNVYIFHWGIKKIKGAGKYFWTVVLKSYDPGSNWSCSMYPAIPILSSLCTDPSDPASTEPLLQSKP